MFREMRRKRQGLSADDARKMLMDGQHGVLALSGDDGYPYAVPISYVLDGKRLLFHSAREGHKIDAIRGCGKASFCVVEKDQVVPKRYTTYFRSVIVFGRIRIVENVEEKIEAITKLAMKYAPSDTEENRTEYIRNDWNALCVFEMEIEHMTGKEAIELTAQKKGKR